MYYRYNQDGSLDTTAQVKKEMENYWDQEAYRDARFFDINGDPIPFKVKHIIGTSDEVKVGASLIKKAAACSLHGRYYEVGKGSSLLSIIKYDKKAFWDINYDEKKRKKIKVSFSLAKY